MSNLAARLLTLLMERPGRWYIEEMARDLRASKTAVRRALAELEEAGDIQIDEEEP